MQLAPQPYMLKIIMLVEQAQNLLLFIQLIQNHLFQLLLELQLFVLAKMLIFTHTEQIRTRLQIMDKQLGQIHFFHLHQQLQPLFLLVELIVMDALIIQHLFKT